MHSLLTTRMRCITYIAAVITFLVAFLDMLGWIFQFRPLLSILPDAATMKFNTAMCFLLTGIALVFTLRKHSRPGIIQAFLILLLLVISVGTLLEYLLQLDLKIDNLFVQDSFRKLYPGRMSQATAFCFMLIGLSFWGIYSRQLFFRRIAQFMLLLVTLVALISIDAFILQIPTNERVFFMDTMALNTSVLFFLTSIALTFKNSTLGFTGLVTGPYAGSRLMRILLPFIIVVPLVFSYFFLLITNNELVDKDFGISVYTVIFILLTIVYMAVNALNLNKTDTFRKRLENSYKETNRELNYFKQALDASFIVATTDERGIIEYVNDNFCRISKFSRDDLIGKTHRLVNSGYHSKTFFTELWRTISAGNEWIGEIKNKAKDGSYYWVHTTIVPFKNQSGKIYKYLAIRQDITSRKQSEVLVQQNFKILEQKNEELEEFAFIASHDLQEPIRTVNQIAGLLDKEYSPQLNEKGIKYLKFLDQASNRMRDLVTALHDYARLGNKSELEFVDCNELLAAVKEDLAMAIQESKAQIFYDELPQLYGYKTDLYHLFQNLMTNALKFRKAGVAPQVHISAERRPNDWKFSVQDNGIGMEEEHSEKVFGLFQRLHARNQFAGTGVGLTYCRKIVRRHGGEIWVESTLNVGSTFFFTIPHVIRTN